MTYRLTGLLLAVVLAGAACSSGDDGADAAPVIVVEGDSAAAETATDGDEVEDEGDEASVAAGDGGASAPADDAADGGETDEQLALRFAQCMRDNGVDFPDPVVDADGAVDLLGGLAPGETPGGLDADDPILADAADVCGDIIAGASFLPGADLDPSELEDDLLVFAQCLRDLGYDVDDPDLSGGLPRPGQGSSLFGDDFDPTDPANAEAVDECRVVAFGPTGFPTGGNG